jgi:hypothetical protein
LLRLLLLPKARALADTPLSAAIQDAIWIVPVVQCVHIVAVAGLIGAVLMLDLKILGFAGRSQSLKDAARRFAPSIWWCAAVAAATGAVMIVAEPVRDLINTAFWSKMLALLTGLAITFAFQARGGELETTPRGRVVLRTGAIASLLVWAAAVLLGRLIAYAQLNLGA